MIVAGIASILARLCLAVSLFALCLTALNALWMRRSAGTEPLASGPLVSVLVPARDEEKGIAACLDSLLSQIGRAHV